MCCIVTRNRRTPLDAPDISASSCSRNRSPSRVFSSVKYSTFLPNSSITIMAGSAAHMPRAACAMAAASGAAAARPRPRAMRARDDAPSKSLSPYPAPKRLLAPESRARRIVADTGSRLAVAMHRIIPLRCTPSCDLDLSKTPASRASAPRRIAAAAPYSRDLLGASRASRKTAIADLPDPYGPVTEIAWPRLPPRMPAPSRATVSSVPAPGMYPSSAPSDPPPPRCRSCSMLTEAYAGALTPTILVSGVARATLFPSGAAAPSALEPPLFLPAARAPRRAPARLMRPRPPAAPALLSPLRPPARAASAPAAAARTLRAAPRPWPPPRRPQTIGSARR